MFTPQLYTSLFPFPSLCQERPSFFMPPYLRLSYFSSAIPCSPHSFSLILKIFSSAACLALSISVSGIHLIQQCVNEVTPGAVNLALNNDFRMRE